MDLEIVATMQRCARTLARSGESVTLGELRDVMNASGGPRVTGAGLKRIMRDHQSFVHLPGDRYQLGWPVPVG